MLRKINKNKMRKFFKNKNRPAPKTAKDSFPKETMQKWDAWVEADGRKEVKNKLSTNIPDKQKTMPTNITKTKNESFGDKWTNDLIEDVKKLLLEKSEREGENMEEKELNDETLGFDKDDELDSPVDLKINDLKSTKEENPKDSEDEDILDELFEDEDDKLDPPANRKELARFFKNGVDRYIGNIDSLLDKLNSTQEGSLNMFLLDMEQKYPQLDFSDYRSISNKILAAATALGDLKEQLNGLVFYIYRTLIKPASKKN